MGNKIHPRGLRTGIIYGWSSKWFGTKRTMPELLRQDDLIRKHLAKKYREAWLDHVDIERSPRALTVTIHTAKPGMVIGRAGAGVDELKKELKKIVRTRDKKFNVNVNILEVSQPNLSANIVAQQVIADLEKRMPFRRTLKQAKERVQKSGAKGMKVLVKGRLNGAEIARDEKVVWGSVPLHNLRADIDFASDFARTIFGAIGVKVWIYRGEVFEEHATDKKPELGAVVTKNRK
jgi:small subunit ribosomal protein S3